MSQPRSLLLPLALGGALLVLVALAGLMWFHFARAVDDGPRALAVPDPAAARESASESTAVLEKPRALGSDGSDTALATKAALESDTRDAAEIVTGREIDGAIWIRGRVTLPPGTALDEPIDVIATGDKWRNRTDYRTHAERDGTFVVAFAKATRKGRLTLDAPHLYLDDPVWIDLRAAPAEISLAPMLGARLHCRLVAYPGAEAIAPELAGQEMRLYTPSGHLPEKAARIASDLTVEFRAVTTESDLVVEMDAPSAASLQQQLPAIAPGVDREVELVFHAGGRVRGRIIDEEGAPIPNARVGVEVVSKRRGWREVASDDLGAFDVRGITPGIGVASANLKGYQGVRRELGELVDGATRDGVELVLDRGNSVSGIVRWPDGTPAEGAYVRAFSSDGGTPQNTRSGADGRFVLGDLPEGELIVHAQTSAPSPKADTDSPPPQSQHAKKPARPTPVHARVDGVQSGDVLELLLRSGVSVSGRVLDDRGQPVWPFRIRAMPEDPLLRNRSLDGRGGSFLDKQGRFAVDGLAEGRWVFRVSAQGHRDSAPVRIEVGGDAVIPDVTLMRAGVVSGVVVFTDGRLISKATVRAVWSKASLDARDASDSASTEEHKTDSQGRFSFDVDPGVTLRFVATCGGSSPSPPLELMVAPGQKLTGIVLALGDPGAIAGRFIARRGETPEGRSVRAWLNGSRGDQDFTTLTDASGEFRFERVPAGAYRISVRPDESSHADLAEKRWRNRNSESETADVVVAAGATSDVVVGREPRAPVAVSGRVTCGGRGVARVGVSAKGAGDRPAGLTLTDGSGGYTLELDEPGTYSFALESPNGTELSKVIAVPEAAKHSVDFELASGRIRGRALNEVGEALQRVFVRLLVERTQSSTGLVASSGSCWTDSDGLFAFDSLPAGTFGVEIDLPRFYSERSRPLAAARVGGLVLEGEGTIDGVELRLEPAGTIDLHVLPDGTRGDGVQIVLRDARGFRVEAIDEPRYSRHYVVAPGRYSVSATRGVEVASEPVVVEVVSGRIAKAELQLVRGTVLEIVARDAAGEVVTSSYSVRDASGADHAALHTIEGSANNAIGPLARGTYIVAAESAGKHVERTVAVTGQERIVVELKYEP